jgi:uncharacterized membrane protein
MTAPETPPAGTPPPLPPGANLRLHAPRALALTIIGLALVLLGYDFGMQLAILQMARGQKPLLGDTVPSIIVAALIGGGLLYLLFTALFRNRLHRWPLSRRWRVWVVLGFALLLTGLGMLLTAVSFSWTAGLVFYGLAVLAVLVAGWQMMRGEL